MIFSQTPTTLILSILTASTFTHALPTTTYPPHPLCKNTLTNPSFATGSLTPWLDMVTGSWSMRGITTTSSNSSGPYIYTAHSNSTTVTATLALSQSYITIPADSTTTTVECYAYVRSDRPTGQTRVQVFLDALSCGEAVALGPGEGREWTRVGGRVAVGEGDKVVGHTVAVSVQGDGVVGGAGWSVDLKEVGVGVGEGC